jgi:hypothetical protein
MKDGNGELDVRVYRLERQVRYLQIGVGVLVVALALLGLSHTDLMRELRQQQAAPHPAK